MMNDRRYLPLLFVVMFLVMVGFGIIIPVLPFSQKTLVRLRHSLVG